MKKLVLILFIILIVVGGVVYYFYSRISYTPDWYDENQHRVSNEMIIQSKGATEKIAAELTSQNRSVIKEEELDTMIIEKIYEQFPRQSGSLFIKAFHSDIQEDMIIMESVVNLEQIPLTRLSARYQKTIREFINTFPKDSRQNFYIQVSGKPVQKYGRIEFEKDARVKLGKMEYPLKSILNQISGNEQLEAVIPLNQLPFNNFRLEEGRIVLEE